MSRLPLRSSHRRADPSNTPNQGQQSRGSTVSSSAPVLGLAKIAAKERIRRGVFERWVAVGVVCADLYHRYLQLKWF